MAQFISIPCKKGYDIKFIDLLSNYVRETYGAEQLNNHKSAFNELNNMRTKMISKLFDKHESTVGVLTKYHDQFAALEGKIPIEENGVRINFKWDDAFGKETLFGKKNSLQIASGGYEKICVLFNIAAIYSQVSEIENLADDNGLKNAAKYLQQAAGIFSFLKSTIPTTIQRETTTDLNPDTLSTLSTIMLAQAQELIYTKAARDQMKEGNVAKIVQQTADLYADSLRLMQLNSVKAIWPKEWIPLIAGKQASFHAIAEYYQAKACGTNHLFGEQIARLKKASELMKAANTRAGQKFLFRSEQDRIKKDLETIEKENNMIYHDTIPEISTLSPILKAVLARELPLENPINKDFKDLFSSIVPLALVSSINMFQNKQKSMVNAEIFRLKEANNILNGILASLNLPALLEDNTSDAVPNVVLEKAAAIRQAGGIDIINQMKNNLPDLVQKNVDLLKESKQMLDEEEDADTKLREQFKDRWNRTPSCKLTESWRGEYIKFSNIVQQANNSDETILKVYQEFSQYIKIMSQSESALKDSIPKSVGQNASPLSQNIKQEVRVVYDNLESVKADREFLFKELDSVDKNDLANQFSKALTIDDSVNHEQLAEEHINAVLIPLREQIRQSLYVQNKCVASLQEKCSKWTGAGGGSESRASIISSMMLAGDKFTELLDNLKEGIKFYGDLAEILLKYQNKVKDFCFARRTEKEELMKDVQSSIVKEKTVITSSDTNFQATSAGTSNVRNQPVPIYGFINPYNPNISPQQRPMAPFVPTAIPFMNTQPMRPSPVIMHQYPPPPPNGPNAGPYMPGVPPPQFQYQPTNPYNPSSQVPQYRPGQVPQYPHYPAGYNYPTYPGYNQPYPPR